MMASQWKLCLLLHLTCCLEAFASPDVQQRMPSSLPMQLWSVSNPWQSDAADGCPNTQLCFQLQQGDIELQHANPNGDGTVWDAPSNLQGLHSTSSALCSPAAAAVPTSGDTAGFCSGHGSGLSSFDLSGARQFSVQIETDWTNGTLLSSDSGSHSIVVTQMATQKDPSSSTVIHTFAPGTEAFLLQYHPVHQTLWVLLMDRNTGAVTLHQCKVLVTSGWNCSVRLDLTTQLEGRTVLRGAGHDGHTVAREQHAVLPVRL
jgi:hypothetical protein